MNQELKNKFAYELKFAKIRGDISELEPKALYDDIAKKWIVGVFYKQGGKLKSFIFVEGKTEQEAIKVAEECNELIQA